MIAMAMIYTQLKYVMYITYVHTVALHNIKDYVSNMESSNSLKHYYKHEMT